MRAHPALPRIMRPPDHAISLPLSPSMLTIRLVRVSQPPRTHLPVFKRRRAWKGSAASASALRWTQDYWHPSCMS